MEVRSPGFVDVNRNAPGVRDGGDAFEIGCDPAVRGLTRTMSFVSGWSSSAAATSAAEMPSPTFSSDATAARGRPGPRRSGSAPRAATCAGREKQ